MIRLAIVLDELAAAFRRFRVWLTAPARDEFDEYGDAPEIWIRGDEL